MIFARSFARIHETNAKKQGLVPLTFADPATYDEIDEDDRINVLDLPPVPGAERALPDRQARRHDVDFEGTHTFSHEQVEWFKAGSALNIVRQKVAAGEVLIHGSGPETSGADGDASRRCARPARRATSPTSRSPTPPSTSILDDARFAPSGGNRQPWRVAVVKDPAIRRGSAS